MCCSDCRYFTGWDGGFFDIPLTTECKHYGDTENRKDCPKFKRPFPRNRFTFLKVFQEWLESNSENGFTNEDISEFLSRWK